MNGLRLTLRDAIITLRAETQRGLERASASARSNPSNWLLRRPTPSASSKAPRSAGAGAKEIVLPPTALTALEGLLARSHAVSSR